MTMGAATNGLEIALNPANDAGQPSILYLGQNNTSFIDSLGIGRSQASASSAGIMLFNPAFTNAGASATFRGIGGGSSRVTWWCVGDMGNVSSSTEVAVGTNDFRGGTLDARVDAMSLGRDCTPSQTASASIMGVFIFN